MNPFALLLRSRKFWLLVLDTVVSLGLFFAAKYAPGALADIKYLIVALQPVVVTVILAIAWEDNTKVKAQADADYWPTLECGTDECDPKECPPVCCAK